MVGSRFPHTRKLLVPCEQFGLYLHERGSAGPLIQPFIYHPLIPARVSLRRLL